VSAILPTAAILCAEDDIAAGHGAWCCPCCGGLNSSAHRPGRDNLAATWCQHERCVQGRWFARTFAGVVPLPEIYVVPHVWAFERRAVVFA
jgi:hypothetical protein